MANYDSTHTGATIDSAVSQVTDSTTDFNVDSNTLVVDKSEDRVGIGTATPHSPLTIDTALDAADNADQDKFALMIRNPANDDNEEIGIGFRISATQDADSAPGGAITFERTDSSSIGSLHFKTAPSSEVLTTRMTIDSSGHSTFKRNIIIDETAGTSNSAVIKLQADRPSSDQTAGEIQFYNNHANAYAAILGKRGSADNYGDLVIKTRNSGSFGERMRIDEDGSVGINESSPAHKLDVDGGIVEQGGALKENLLTNSGFDVWSNSTLENVGTSYILNDDSDMDTVGNWEDQINTAGSSESGGQAGNFLKVLQDSGGAATASIGVDLDTNGSDLVAGKLYRVIFYVKNDGSMTENVRVVLKGATNQTAGSVATTGSWVQHTIVFESLYANSYCHFESDGDTADDEWFGIDTVTFFEVTPGCVAADDKAMDGWTKTVNTLDIYREHNHATYSKDGSFYSLKAVKGGAGAEYLVNDRDNNTNLEWTQRFAGRVITIGAWVYSVSASDNVKLAVYNHSGWTVSSAFAGADAWEWMELTVTVNASVTNLRYGFLFDGDSADVAYISQPMLVFGSSIGEGNYTRPQGEIVWFEKAVDSNKYEGLTGQSDEAMTTLNLEADSNGAIPKGAKAVTMYTFIKDSGSAGGDSFLRARAVSTLGNFWVNDATGKANDAQSRFGGWQSCDSSGDIQVQMEATGSGTLDIDGFEYKGVELR